MPLPPLELLCWVVPAAGTELPAVVGFAAGLVGVAEVVGVWVWPVALGVVAGVVLVGAALVGAVLVGVVPAAADPVAEVELAVELLVVVLVGLVELVAVLGVLEAAVACWEATSAALFAASSAAAKVVASG